MCVVCLECDREATIMRRPSPGRGYCAMGIKLSNGSQDISLKYILYDFCKENMTRTSLFWDVKQCMLAVVTDASRQLIGSIFDSVA
jgi:hypothetical protein